MEDYHKEIDLFEFIEITWKRKYLILSILLAAIIATSIYCYFLRSALPKKYTINLRFRFLNQQIGEYTDSFRETNQILNAIKSQFVGSTIQWFQNRMYKAGLQEKHKLVNMPDVNLENKGDFINLSLNHHNPEEGELILKDIFDIFLKNEIYFNFKNNINKIFNESLEKKQIILATTDREIDTRKGMLSDYHKEIGVIDEKMKILDSKLIQLREKRTNFDHTTNSEKYLRSNYDHEATVIDFISTLQRQQIRIKSLIQWINIDLSKFDRESSIQRNEIQDLKNGIERSHNLLDINNPYYEELPVNHHYSNFKIIGFTGVLAMFLGIMIAFILWVKDRKHETILIKPDIRI